MGITRAPRNDSEESLSSYWSSQISAVIADANPYDVVLTFPSAKPALPISDIAIAGKTFSGGIWAGPVLTLTATAAFKSTDGNQSITFKGANAKTVTNNVTWSTDMTESYVAINTTCVFSAAQKALIKARLQESYVVTTFGPDGTNKTVCDFFIFLQSTLATALTTRTITKSGDTLRWNYGGGNVYSQNNLPGQICDGVVSVTSTDGFSGVTVFDIQYNSMTGNLFNVDYYMTEILTFRCPQNMPVDGIGLSSQLPSMPPTKIVTMDFSGNDFSGEIPDLTPFTKELVFSAGANKRLTGTIRSTATVANFKIKQLDFINCKGINGLNISNPTFLIYFWRLQGCSIPTADIDTFLNKVATYFDTWGFVFGTLTLNFTNLCNGYLTGGAANADHQKLIAKAAALGKTYTGTFNYKTSFDKGKIAFTFDDVPLSIHTVGLPFFTSKGITGTVYQATNFIDQYIATYNEYACGWEELEDLETAGWTIGCHGKAHLNYKTATEAQMITDADGALTDFSNAGFTTPAHFAYPFGGYNDTSKAVISARFRSARLVDDITKSVNVDSDPFLLTVVVIDGEILNRLPTFTEIKPYIDHAHTYNVGIIFLGHCMVNGSATNNYQVPVSLMTEIVDYCQGEDVDVDIVNMEQLVTLIEA